MNHADVEGRILRFGDFDKKTARRWFWLPTVGLAVWWNRVSDFDIYKLSRARTVRWMWVIEVWPWAIVLWRRR